MTNRRIQLKRIFAGFAALFLLFCAASDPAAQVSAADYSLDTSDFVVPEVGEIEIYYWYKGVPPKDGKAYECMIVPDGFTKYFKLVDADKECKGKSSYDKGDFPKAKLNHIYLFGHQGDTSSLEFDYQLLKEGGYAISFKKPDDLVTVTWVRDELPRDPADSYDYRFALGAGGNDWLVGQFTAFCWVETGDVIVPVPLSPIPYVMHDVDLYQHRTWDWNAVMFTEPAEVFLGPGYLTREAPIVNQDGKVDSYRKREVTLEERTWRFGCSSDSDQVTFFADPVDNIDRVTRTSGNFSKQDKIEALRTRRSYAYFAGGPAGFYYCGEPDTFGTTFSAKTGTYNFDVYYVKPETVFYVKKDITVVDGQVSTLDGPMMLTRGHTITVKDGGVLSLTDWIINNGKIVVEPGGTILLQNGTRISTMNTEIGLESGEITVNGTAILMSDTVMYCGGTKGFTVGSTGNVINYGAIIAENMTITRPNSVENRGKNSYIFPGWGCLDSGIAMVQRKITGGSFANMGKVEKSARARVEPGAVFGEGSSRVYTYPSKSS